MVKELKRWFIQKRAKYFDFRMDVTCKRIAEGEYRTEYRKHWFLKKKYRRKGR